MDTPPPAQEKTESIIIEADGKKFTLLIKSIDESMTFIATDPEEIGGCKYIRKMDLKDIKEKVTQNLLAGLNTCEDFSVYLKALAEMKKLFLTKKEDKISMSFVIEYLLIKKHNVEIDLFPEKTNVDEVIRQLCKEVGVLKEEVKVLKMNKIENLEKENKELKIL